VRQVKEIEWRDVASQEFAQDPCRLVRQVNKILQLQPGNLIHLPDEPAGV